ncbi:ATP synthase subunit alpha, partial [Xanthomonas hyacinthi DSM 19077]
AGGPRGAAAARCPRQWRAQLGRKHPLLIVKDIPQHSPLLDATDNAWAHVFLEACERSGYVLLRGQALAWVPIDFASTDDYLARLSRGRRRNIRRKLRSRADLQIEELPTGAA